MGRKVLFGVVLSILLIGGTTWFFHAKKARTPIPDGINAIPNDAGLIFESRQALNSWKKLSTTNIMWEELLSTETVRRLNAQAVSIDSALQLNTSIASVLEGRSAYVSLHPGPRNTIDALYVISLPDLTWQTAVEDYFESTINRGKPIYTAEEIGDARIGVLQLQQGSLLYFAVSSGILIMSSRDQLLRTSVQQLQAGTSIAKDESFRKVKNATGENVDANLYVNYKQLPVLLKKIADGSSYKDIERFADFADYSGWDINIKPNALSLSGFTSPGNKNFLTLFRDQKPQELELTKILPANTSALLYYGVSNIKGFHDDYVIYQAEKQKSKFMPAGEEENLILELMEGELATIITDAPEAGNEDNRFNILRTNQPDDAVQLLLDLGGLNEKEKKDTISYQGYLIGKTKISGLLLHLFGRVFPESYFTCIDGYIVTGHSVAALKTFIDDNVNHRTLAANKNFKAFYDNLSAETSILFYSSMARSADLYAEFLDRNIAAELHLKKELLKKFEAIGIQFNSGNKLFYSNVYLKYNPEQKQEIGTLWETSLETTFSARPFLLLNHNTKAKEVFVQDDANKIYLISNTGKVIWTKQLNEKIMSDVSQVDVFDNGKLQMVFNTRSFIYMFDRNGNEMKGFPLKLRSPATNGISVIDYEKNHDYRIFIATENKRIVCYKANGEQVTAFGFDKTEDQVILPVQYFSAAAKDHLCAIDMKGRIYILDRQGKVRIDLRERMPQGIRNFFVEPGRDYNRSSLIAADTNGKISRIFLSGKREEIDLGDFETSPFFEMYDLNDDKTIEFIFLSRNELKVFAQDKSLIFNQEFREHISLPPLIFDFPDNTVKIGVVSDRSNELYLFNENGTLFPGLPVNGKTLFSIGDLNNEGRHNLVTGSGENSIFVYQLR